jgi:Ca-activated chloride channel family protein
MQFAYPQGRNFLVLAFAAAALALVALLRKRRALGRLAQQGIHQPGMMVRPSLQILKWGMFVLAAGLLGIAILGPQWGWTEEEVPPRRGRDVLILLDVSRSMLAEDAAPNRLERAKADLRDLAAFLERADGYRIGLLAFAERAAVLCPLTSDYRCFEEELAAASLESLRLRGRAAWNDGTQIALALERADQAIDDTNAAYTDVLLVSDGDDMARETLTAAASLSRRGITVHTLGVGDSTHGALIPVRDSLGRPAHLRYRSELVYTHLQEAVLRAIAQTTHGHYFAAGTSYRDLDRQFGELLVAKESLQRQTVHHQRHGIPRFAWFVTPALLLLLLHGLLSDARRRQSILEPPHYFSWVKKRTNYKVTDNPSLKRERRNTLRSRFRLGFSLLFLCVLCDSAVSSSPPGDPWAAFHRGNELLSQALQAGMNADPAKLRDAQRQYQACLSCQAAMPQAVTLFEDARYNQEMTKLLLMQVSRPSATDPKQMKQSNTNDSTPSLSNPRVGGDKQKSDAQRITATASQDKEKGQSSSQAQRQQQQSQEKSESCSTCQTGQNQSASGRKMKEGGQGSRSGKGVPSPSGQSAGDRTQKTPSANDAQSRQGEEPGPGPTSTFGEDGRQKRDPAPRPDASGLSHTEAPTADPNPSKSEERSQGDSAGTGSGTEKTMSTMDPVRQTAVLRLQAAIQRIEKRRNRSGSGPASSPEDPANQHRYRDW